MMRPRQGAYKPPVHECKSIWERDAAMNKAAEERDASKLAKVEDWIFDNAIFFIAPIFLWFLITGWVNGPDPHDREPQSCSFHYRGACDG